MPTWGQLLTELTDIVQQKAPLPKGWSPFDLLRRKYLSALHTHTGRNVIVYASRWTAGGGEPEAMSMTPEDLQGFMEVINGLTGDSLDLILHLPGGSAEATEALVSYIRSKFKDLRVIVPHAAMSAATMLACAADSIVMGKHSFLGPIDPQFIIRGDLGPISVAAYAIVEQFHLAQEECKDPARLPSWLPILRQYGPALIVQCQLAQKLSFELVSDWLATYMFAGQNDPQGVAKEVAEKLVNHGDHKSHSRFLPREKLKVWGLAIEDLEADQKLQDLVLSVFHSTTLTFTSTPTAKIVENHQGKAFIKAQQTLVVQQPLAVPTPTPAPGKPASPLVPPSFAPTPTAPYRKTANKKAKSKRKAERDSRKKNRGR